jgi:LEA14-like dessication related protein
MKAAFLAALATSVTLLVAACAGMPGHEPVQVTVADIDSLPSEGMEVRMLVKLRVQNPNDAPIEYDGVYLKFEVQGNAFATGVSDERGTIPRFGESIVSVPVTASALRIALQTLGMIANNQLPEKIHYRMDGKLNGPMFGSTSFQSQGELRLPANSAPIPSTPL